MLIGVHPDYSKPSAKQRKVLNAAKDVGMRLDVAALSAKTGRFYFFQRARFAKPGNQAMRHEFERLGKRVLPPLQQKTKVRMLASGITSKEMWAIWSIPTLQHLWAAMLFDGQNADYANMQELIVGEQQNFCRVHLQKRRQPVGKYRYALVSKTVGVTKVNETLFEFETLFLNPEVTPWSWSVTLLGITGNLYTLRRVWRCESGHDFVEIASPGSRTKPRKIRTWEPARYEPVDRSK